MRRFLSMHAALAGVAWLFASLPSVSTAETVSFVNCGPGGSGSPSGQSCMVVSGLVAGDTIDLAWELPAGVQNNDGDSLPVALTATGSIYVSEINNGNIVLDIAIANTTQRGSYTGRLDLTAFGFTTGDNTVSGGSEDSSVFAFSTANFPAFSTDGCFFTGQNCAGAGTSGLGDGQSDTFTATINGDFTADQLLTLDTFATKWQTGNGSYELAAVPIPAAAWLFGSALLGMVGIGARRRQAA